MAILSCPKCKKENDGKMAFCIFCGGPLKPAANPAETLAAPTAPATHASAVPTSTASAPTGILCPSCNRTDPLNARFCVLCGVDIAATTAHSKHSAVSSDGPAPTKARGNGLQMVVSVVLAAALGTACGVAVAVCMPQQSGVAERPIGVLGKLYPKQTDVLIKTQYHGKPGEPSKERYIFGRVSNDGTFAYSDLAEGTYDLTVGSDQKVLTAKDGHTVVSNAGQ